MATQTLSTTSIVAILLATVAALVARSWLQLRLLGENMAPQTAADLSFLLVPFVLAVLLFPLWRSERAYLLTRFRIADLTLKLVVTAFMIGILLRLLWWGQLVFGISFGLHPLSDSAPVVGPVFSFQCPGPALMTLSVLVLSVLTPVIEEVVHRGYILTALRKRGMLVAIVVSAIVFAVFHKLASLPFAFFGGIIFGLQYWKSGSLWPSLITHSTVNTLVIFDWRCLTGQWNPVRAELPLLLPGAVAAIVIVVCVAALTILLRRMATEA